MNKDILINYNINQKWRKARIKFCENQIETIGRLTSVLSDMPKGSRKVYDNEAEDLTKLMDQIRKLEKEIEDETVEQESKIKEKLEKLESKYGLLLYHHYILGDSIKYIAREVLHYGEKYVYELKQEALEKFSKL